MKFLKNKFKFISLIVFTLSFCFNVSAATLEDCGTNNTNNVKTHDYSICEEDLSFRTLYEFFPDIWDESFFPIFELEYVENLSNDEDFLKKTQYLKFSNIFKKILTSILNISTFCIFLLIMYKSMIAIFNSLENGKFLGGRWKPSTAIKAGSITMFLLLPVGDGIMMINLIVLLLATLAISIANYFYGFYLSTIDVLSKNTTIEQIVNDKENKLKNKSTEDLIGHNAFYASYYLDNITKIEMCRQRTAQYLLEDKESEIHDYNIEQNFTCAAPETNVASYFYTNKPNFSDFDYESFIDYRMSKLTSVDDTDYMTTSSIMFSRDNTKEFNCREFETYECGEIKLNIPISKNNEIINVFLKNDFFNITNNTISSLTNDEGANYTSITSGWSAIKEAAINKITAAFNTDNDSIARKILNEDGSIKDNYLFKHTSYVYHTLILNSILVGHIDLQTKKYENSVSNVFGSYTNIAPFLENYNDIKELAYLVQEYHCMVNSSDLDGTINLREKILNNAEIKKASFRCLSSKNLNNINVDIFGTKLNEFAEGGFTVSELKTKEDEIINLYNELKTKIYYHREAVEMAFIDSISEYSNSSFLVELRKKGWLTFGSYLLQLNKEININQGIKKGFVNNINFNISKINPKMISKDIYVEDEKKSSLYKELTERSNPILKLSGDTRVESSYYMDSSLKTKYALENHLDKDNSDTSVLMEHLKTFINPIGAIKDALGMTDNSGWLMNESIDYTALCETDISKCPIPKENPFIQLNTVGHYFVNNATAYFGAVIILSSGSQLYQKTTNLEKRSYDDVARNETAGSFDKKAKEISDKRKSLKKTKNKYALLDLLSQFLSLMNTFMFFILLAGLVMAYLIPLLPFLYFLVGFLNWFVLVVKVFLISPVWAAFFINYDENKDRIIKFMKAQSLEILLKPVFLVCSMIFVWSLYSAIIFFINMTILPMLNSMTSDGFIMSMISGILLSVVFLFIIYIITSKIFDIMNEVYVKIFEAIEVQVSRDDEDNFNDLLQYFVAKELLESGKKGFGKINKVGTNLNQIMEKTQRRKDLWDKLNQENKKLPRFKQKSKTKLIMEMEKIIKETKNGEKIYGKI